MATEPDATEGEQVWGLFLARAVHGYWHEGKTRHEAAELVAEAAARRQGRTLADMPRWQRNVVRNAARATLRYAWGPAHCRQDVRFPICQENELGEIASWPHVDTSKLPSAEHRIGPTCPACSASSS